MNEHLQDLWVQCFNRISEMEERYKAAPSLYESLAASSEKLVSSWNWTALPRYELEPFYFELGDCRRGRLMKKEPEKIAGRHQYGFSSSGELIVEREHVEFPGHYYETFFRYADEELSSYRYHHNKPKAPINCRRMFIEDEDVMCFQSWATGGCSQHIYVVSKGRIVWRLTSHMPNGRKPFGGITAIDYVDNGEVKIWSVGTSGTRSLAYHGPVVANNTIERSNNKLRLFLPSLREAGS